MIIALDHFVLLCPHISAATADYEALLGIAPAWQADADGVAISTFALGNTAIELIAPSGDGETADKLRALTADGAKMTTLVYRSDDLADDHHVMTRRGLGPSEIADGTSMHKASGDHRSWQRFRIPDEQMAGVKTFVLQTDQPLAVAPADPGAATALDHLVINTPNPERTVANYGARLGLRFALDRTAEQWKTRFLFFRLGGLTLEIINRLGETHDPSGPDSIWGLTWETDDLEAAHSRLSATGHDLSEIRTGRKPGTTVFTVRDRTQGVPTLFIAHAKR
ncbi:MAG: VOC family protein [Henriciella sp.]|nr:VOC family protein [Henriciella sp.]